MPAQVLSESLAWMARAVEEFGVPQLDMRLLMEWLRANLASTNAGVRNAASALAGVCHQQLGPGLAGQLREHVKPALMAALEETFAANPQQAVWPCLGMHARVILQEQVRVVHTHPCSARVRCVWGPYLLRVVLRHAAASTLTMQVHALSGAGTRADGADSCGAAGWGARGARPGRRSARRFGCCRRGPGTRSGKP